MLILKRKKENSNKLTLQLKQLEKEWTNPKLAEGNEIMKMRSIKQTIEKQERKMKQKVGSSKRSSNIKKPLAR